MKYLLVGLGNIGEEYENTRHNIGFNIVDAIAKAHNAVFKLDRHASVAEVKYKSRTIILIKPTTFMNLSGKAVQYWLQKEHIPIENALILVDDLALPFETMRMKGKGSDGGHNGLKHIQATLGHANYARLRFGIGNNFSKGQQIDFVLGEWDRSEQEKLPALIDEAKEAALLFCTQPLERAVAFTNQNNK
ncbi:MAG: aminoacyl-tRNA hydrolase [Bacteroidales bacterium]|jgi:PTH1 family peptidyl-tRNA hydrolase|nr:aminoacyl-tRNA hydrolase [Bacteroidales bacterium]